MERSFLVIDTETTGVPDFKAPADHPDQPRLAAVCMVLCAGNGRPVDMHYQLVCPDGWHMPPEAGAINKLTDAYLQDEGKPVLAALDRFERFLRHGRPILVAHSVTFDSKIMRGELRRAGMPDLFAETDKFCTMQAARKIIGGSIPSLATAMRHFLGRDPSDAHCCLSDAMDCRELYLELRAQMAEASAA